MVHIDSRAALELVRKRKREERVKCVAFIADKVEEVKKSGQSSFGIVARLIKESQDLFSGIKEHTVKNKLRKRKKAAATKKTSNLLFKMRTFQK